MCDEIFIHFKLIHFFVVNIDEENKTESVFSEYFDTMTAGPSLNVESKNSTSHVLNIVVHVLCVLILLVLFLLMALCFLHRYYSKHSAQGEEVISLRDSLRYKIFYFSLFLLDFI